MRKRRQAETGEESNFGRLGTVPLRVPNVVNTLLFWLVFR